MNPVGISTRQPGGDQRSSARRAASLVELLVVIAIIGILVSLLLPAVSANREAARRLQCAHHLRQVGVALYSYHNTYTAFPPGHVVESTEVVDGKSWGWGALLLPFIEERTLSDRLEAALLSFDEVASDRDRAPHLRTDIPVYRCPSDLGTRLSHRFRALIVTGAVSDLFASASTPATGQPAQAGLLLGHALIPPPPPPPPPPTPDLVPRPEGGFPRAASIAKSNYVASIGNQWKPLREDWDDDDFEGNGLFGRNSSVRTSQIVDGASKTLAVGERSELNYAAVWAGGNSWTGCGFIDNQMVLGTAFYPINDAPVSQNVDCDGSGSANFSSFHPGGANFLFADGSLHFVPERIDAAVFQNLAQRNDGQSTDDF